jgi:colanic acid/amylovoran biosynthesis glycosyltransferase
MNKIAYLANPYPAISHTFIFREIEALRREGFEIATASIHRAPDIDKMSKEEQQEAKSTYVLRETTLAAGLRALLDTLSHSPLGFIRMTIKALSFSRGSKSSLTKCLCYLAEAVLLIPWLRRQKISHIHEHFGNPTALVALLCKTYGGFSYSLSLHGPDIFYQVDSGHLNEKVSSASFVRCISNYCRSQILRVVEYSKWSRQEIVRCGVDPKVFRPVRKKRCGKPTLVCVGRLCPAKGQHILIESCAALGRKGVDFKLVLVGDGPDRKSLEKLVIKLGIEQFVTFTGALGQKEVQDRYREADIFVLPSFAEGVPVVLMEAMAMGLPVISTRITGIPELIDNEVNGLLATPGDAAELSRLLTRLIDKPKFGKKLGIAGRKKIIAEYDQCENNKKLANLFRQYGEPHVFS